MCLYARYIIDKNQTVVCVIFFLGTSDGNRGFLDKDKTFKTKQMINKKTNIII